MSRPDERGAELDARINDLETRLSTVMNRLASAETKVAMLALSGPPPHATNRVGVLCSRGGGPTRAVAPHGERREIRRTARDTALASRAHVRRAEQPRPAAPPLWTLAEVAVLVLIAALKVRTGGPPP